jgi:hypothetical protein
MMRIEAGSFISAASVRSAVKSDQRHTFWALHLITMREPRKFLHA